VGILLVAGASFYADPVTHITEGSDTEEVQQAILRFLHRSDQTSRTIAATIRTIALAQPQNPNLNDDFSGSSIRRTLWFAWNFCAI
jgi:hypothetical protein